MNYAEVYEILIEHCDAPSRGDAALAFVYQMNSGCREHRFQGLLGFGGKLYSNDLGLHVSCYPEDETPERLSAIERANAALKALQ